MSLTQVPASMQEPNAQYTGFKNRIINGAMMIDQRGSASTPVQTGYSVDRWAMIAATGAKLSLGQSSTAPSGFNKSLVATSLSAYSLVTNDTYGLRQPIEGFNVADLGFGAAGASTVTLSFWVRCSLTGTFGGALLNNAADRSYTFTYTINSANTWEYKTVTISGDTSGTWTKDNTTGLDVRFGLGTSGTFTQAAGSWGTANAVQPAGCVSLVGTNGATFYITGVQLEKGSTATSFDYRPYGTELQLCQRYYYKWLNNTGGGRYIANLQAYASTGVYGKLFDLPVPMRASPTCTRSGTITVYNANSNSAGNPSVVTLNQVTPFSIGCDDMYTGLSGLVAGNCSVTSMAANGYFDASAEL